MYECADGTFYVISSNGLYWFDAAKKMLIPKRNKPVEAYKWRDDGFGPYVAYGDIALWIGSWGGGLNYYHMKTNTWKIYKFDLKYPELSTHNIVRLR